MRLAKLTRKSGSLPFYVHPQVVATLCNRSDDDRVTFLVFMDDSRLELVESLEVAAAELNSAMCEERRANGHGVQEWLGESLAEIAQHLRNK